MCYNACQEVVVAHIGKWDRRQAGRGCRNVHNLLAVVQQVLAAEAHIVLSTVHVIL